MPLQRYNVGKPISNSIHDNKAFKTISSKQVNQIRQTPGIPVWQRNYYEHIIRNNKALNQIKEYIQNNPFKWHLDRENPQRTGIEPLEEEIFGKK